jgi:hypothetical protein
MLRNRQPFLPATVPKVGVQPDRSLKLAEELPGIACNVMGRLNGYCIVFPGTVRFGRSFPA